MGDLVGWLFLFGLGYGVYRLFAGSDDSSDGSAPSSTPGHSGTAASPDARRARDVRRDEREPGASRAYRPHSNIDLPAGIRFVTDTGASAVSSTSAVGSIEGLHDAFTGEPLVLERGLYRCRQCQVYYHSESHQVLVSENSGRCVACPSTRIEPLSLAQEEKPAGRDHNPDVVTLGDYKNHVGRVVTFEGRVAAVRVSRRGSDYAVMFEDKSWTKGFKLVFFKGSVRRVGGPDWVLGLKGSTMRVRGLIVRHPKFGHEIIVSERAQILEVREVR